MVTDSVPPPTPHATNGGIGFDLAPSVAGMTLRLWGEWSVWTIGAMEAQVAALQTSQRIGKLLLDTERVSRIDTAGALMLNDILAKLNRQDVDHIAGDRETLARLLKQVRRGPVIDAPPPPRITYHSQLTKLGQAAVQGRTEAVETLTFLGEAMVALVKAIINPKLFRWPATVHSMEVVGLNALPILSTLSFFIGMVIAYMGVNLLRTFGAEVFTVELVGVSVLREFGVLITAILVAGRTDSAYAAELGAMKLNEEVDALKAMGLDPMYVLVTPRIVSLLVMLPLLTFAAMIAGLAGGLLVLWTTLDMNPAMALVRIGDQVPQKHFWVGMAKAPVFGLILGIIGCRQGLAVARDVASLGSRTTAAVVQSIFLVVVVDAIFAIAYLELGL